MSAIEKLRASGATAADLARPVSYGDLLAHLDLLVAEIRAVKARVAETESKSMCFRGVYQPAEQYERGDLATFRGALWHCNHATTDKPGDGGTSWQMAVKNGGAT